MFSVLDLVWFSGISFGGCCCFAVYETPSKTETRRFTESPTNFTGHMANQPVFFLLVNRGQRVGRSL